MTMLKPMDTPPLPVADLRAPHVLVALPHTTTSINATMPQKVWNEAGQDDKGKAPDLRRVRGFKMGCVSGLRRAGNNVVGPANGRT